MHFTIVKLLFCARSPPHFLKKILTDGRAQRGKFFHISIRFLCDAFYYFKTGLVINIAPPLPPAILCVDKIGSRPRGNLCVDKIGSVPQDRAAGSAIPFSPGQFWRAGRLSHYAPTTAHSHG